MVALIETKSCSLGDHPRVVDVVDRQQLDRRVVVRGSRRAAGVPSAKVPTALVRLQRLRTPVDHARLDEVDDAVGEQLRVDAEVAVVRAALRSTAFGIAPMPAWMRRAVGDALGDELGDAAVDVVGRAPAAPRRAARPPRTTRRPGSRGAGCGRTCAASARLASRKNGARPMNDADVVGVRAEREVAVAVRRRGGREHERVGACAAQQVAAPR